MFVTWGVFGVERQPVPADSFNLRRWPKSPHNVHSLTVCSLSDELNSRQLNGGFMLSVKKRAWTVFGMMISVLVTVQTRSQTKMLIPDALRHRVQTTCRDYVQRNLKAPDSAEFQEEREDFVEWKKNVGCRHTECTGVLFFVRTRAYAINSFNARLLHKFSCDVVCDNTGYCSVQRMWEDE